MSTSIDERPTRSGDRIGLCLKVLLRYIGSVSLLAMVAVVMPFSWMEATHRWLGMGELSPQPVTGYLARTLSLFYAMLGSLLWFVSFRTREYQSFLCFFSLVFCAFGVLQIWIDFHQGLPGFWKYAEGPMVIVFGASIFLLSTALNRPDSGK